MRPHTFPLLLLPLLLLYHTVAASNIRHQSGHQSTTRMTLAEALAEVPTDLILSMKPPTSETIVEKSNRIARLQIAGQKQKMVLSTGTTVTLWAPDQLTPQELATAAQTVNHLAKEISDCFCTFRPKKRNPSSDGLISSIEPQAEQNCVCTARGKLTENIPTLAPTDFYGTTLPKSTTMDSVLRYDVPVGSIETDQLILSMDAGDRRSYDARHPSVWKNVANNDDAPGTELLGHLHGFIGFNSTEGSGSLRLGAHGDRDVIIVPALDIGKSKAATTVEIWLKLSKYETSTGRAFGNSLDEHTLGGRSLFVHNLLYSTDRKLDPPPASFDPTWTGTHARLGATAGHLYDSDIVPPKLHEWVHYVTVWDQNEVNMYQNGKLVGREALYGDGNDSISTLGSQNFCIGNHEFSHKGGKFKLNGYVGLVRVWSKALLSSSVVQLHAHAKERFSN